MTPPDTSEYLEGFLERAGIVFERSTPDTFVVELPGTRKLKTNVSLTVGPHAVTVNAFVARKPDEQAPSVHAWLLEQNRRMYGVAFAIDQLGDIYLTGKVPLTSLNDDELDRLLGCVLEYSDGAFNTVLEIGFASAIRREWAWRVSRGESTENLDAFAHLIAHSPDPESGPEPQSGPDRI
jgi:Putative bacterial sensory transduction regulator